MYASHYGLTKPPFDTTPDPGVVFMSEAHKEALSVLRYGVIERKQYLLLTGDVGTGKTTLLNMLINSLNDRVHHCLISNPSLSVSDFYRTLANGLDLPPPGQSKAQFLVDFGVFLRQCRRQNKRLLLFIDEAHVLSVRLLEEIRLLSNQAMQNQGVLSIFLVGQPELNQRLGHQRLLPLRQRIGMRFHLKAFDQDETISYINFRLRRAGATHTGLFTAQALTMIHKASRGVPRLINTLCDQALLTGFAENKAVIDTATIRDCVRELHIPGESTLLPLPKKQILPMWLRNRSAASLWAGLAALILALVGVVLWHDIFSRFSALTQHIRNITGL